MPLPGCNQGMHDSEEHWQAALKRPLVLGNHDSVITDDIDLLVNRRVTIGFFPWRFVDGESSIGRCVAMVDDDEYEQLMQVKASLPKSRFGDAYDPKHVDSINRLSAANLA